MEAEAAIRAPPPPQAVFPFRNDAEDEHPHATPSHSSSNNKKRGAGNTHPSQTGDIEPDDRIQTSSRPGTAAANPRIDHEDTTRIGPPKAKKGTVKPHHSLSVQKYSCSLMHGPVRTLLQNSILKNALYCHDPKFANACLDLVSASLARNTWKQYNSALRLWKTFQAQTRENFDFLNPTTWNKKFIIWGWSVRQLAVSTIKIYLSELEKLGKIAKGLETLGTGLEKIFFQGMSNLGSHRQEKTDRVVPLTIADLKRIRINLGKQNRKFTGQSVWACCLTAFWGAFRLGELLGRSSYKFDVFSDLLLEDINWGQDWVRIKIKSAKVKGPPGNSALLFSIPDQKLCPVAALARLKKSQANFSMGNANEPVFRETNGKFLTKRVFLDIVNKMKGRNCPQISGKSFRSALPSALENIPNSFRESHIKALGRWRGHSYQVYMRNDEPEFRRVFETISSALLKQNPVQENWESDPATWTVSWGSRKGSSARKAKRTQARSKIATEKKEDS